MFAKKYGAHVTVGELMVMSVVLQTDCGERQAESCTATSIINETGLAKSTVNSAIARLIQRGFIAETTDQDDARVKLLTPGSAHSDLEDPAVELSAVRRIICR